jgi:polysaccharide deacetylase family protein (PEP-CTERM system associated)
MARAGSAAVANAMSVDVEDWFQVQAFARVIARDSWDSLPRRVEANTDRVLDAFARRGVRATFFTLGWVAERHPALVRRIAAAGHEVASHGHGHELVHLLGEAAFRADIRRAKQALEDASGQAVVGYRAPTFSIGPRRTPWAHDALAAEGYRYSSSVFPVRHDLYGEPDAPRGPWRTGSGVVELPMTTVRMGGRNLPCAGGGWFRLLPEAVFHAGLRRVNAEGRSGIFYFHPWEIDPAQPRIQAGRLSRFRHYTGLAAMEGRLDRLLTAFRWARMDEVFADILSGAAAPVPATQAPRAAA